MKTCATLCAGGRLADLGLIAAGLTPLWDVEYVPEIAAVGAQLPGRSIVADIRAVDYDHLERPDLLWASPPCPNFSVAKTGRGETPQDLEIAGAVIRAIETLRPQALILENVEGYADSESFRRIRAALDRLDYWSHAAVVNAADLGVPQTRRRLILRARAGGWMQAHRPWPAPVKWRGWYDAIADLIPTLPDSAFAPWQLARLPAELRDAVMIDGRNVNQEYGKLHRTGTEPSITITTDGRPSHWPRAFILDGQESGAASGLTVRHGEAPVFTVTSGTGTKRGARAWLVPNATECEVRAADDPSHTITSADYKNMRRALIPPGRVVSMTPRALARFQAVPDWYQLPDKKSLACRIIGNGVAVDVARVAAETLREGA